MSDIIASRELVAISPDGDRIPVFLRIGRPYQSHTKPDMCSCAVALDPLYPNLPDQVGSDSFQALWLACGLAINLLRGYKESGGRILFQDGSNYPLDALAFAHLNESGPHDNA